MEPSNTNANNNSNNNSKVAETTKRRFFRTVEPVERLPFNEWAMHVVAELKRMQEKQQEETMRAFVVRKAESGPDDAS